MDEQEPPSLQSPDHFKLSQAVPVRFSTLHVAFG